MLRHLGRLLGSCAVVALLFIACRDGATGPGLPRTVSLSLTPRFQAGAESALPVNRIRIAAYRVLEAPQQGLDPTPLATTEIAVDPTDETWTIPLDVPVLGGAPLRVQATLELLNVAGGGASTVEWAGRTSILTVVAGRDVTQEDLPIGRGPLPNLDIEDLFIGEFPSTIVRGDSIDLTATLEPEVAGSRLFWSSLDAGVATIDADGRVRSLVPGTVRIAATAGFRADTVSISVIDPTSRVRFLVVFGDPATRQGTVGTALPQPVRVGAWDEFENPVPGVPVSFAVTSGGGTITGPTTITTDAQGVAQLGGWTLGTTAGAQSLTASIAGTQLTAIVTATGVAGAAQNLAYVSGSGQSGSAGVVLSQPLVARVRDQFNNPVANVRVDFATAHGGTFSQSADTSGADGLVQVTWTPGFTQVAQVATATAAGVTGSVQFAANVALPPPQVQLALAGTDKVGVGLTQQLDVTLPTPAPAGGATVTLANGNAAVLSLATTTVSFAAGQSAQAVNVTGIAEGTAGITATSPQYQTGTLNVAVELRVLGTPTSVNVPYGQTASLPINIPRPAPTGGITVQVTSSDPSRVSVAQAGVVIPGGATTGSATLNGVLPGPAQVVVSHPFYVWDTTAVTTTAALDILNTTYTINQSFGAATPVRFLSNGVPIAAPSPGVPVNVVSRNPACVSVPATLTIPTGLTETSLAIAWNAQGGVTTFPCTSRVVVSTATTGIAFDSATVTVNATPSFTVTDASIGIGLQRSWSATLGASNHGGVTVRITSPDPTQVLVARSTSEVGSEFIDIPTVNGTTQVNFVVQALDGARVGANAIRASAPGFVDDAGTATVVTPGLEVISVTTNPTSLSGDDDFYVRVGAPEGQGRFLNEVQDRRWGGAPLVATATASNPAIIQLVNAAGVVGTTATAQIAEGQSNTPTQRTNGGMAVRPIGNGTATVTASIPGFITTSSNGTATVTVTTPVINAGGATVGAGLQRSMNASLAAAAPTGGVTVRVASDNPAVLRIAPNATTAGADFIDVVVNAGGFNIPFYIQGVEGQTGQVAVTISTTGYATARPTMNVVTPGLELINLNTTTTTLSGDDAIYARIGTPETLNRFLNEIQDVRAGGAPITVTFTSGTPTVGTLVTTAGAQGGTATATIAVGQSNTPTTVASGGVALRPLTAGGTRVSVASPGLVTTTSNGAYDVAISQPTQSPGSNITVGAGLQRSLGGSLQASSHGGVTVRLTSSDPSRVLLATSATATAAAFIDIPVANNVGTYSYYVHGLENQTGTATITATTPGFANGTNTVTVATPSLEVIGLNSTTTTLTANDEFYIRIGVPDALNRFLNEVQDVRTGGVPVTATITTSNPGVAQLVPSSTNGVSATVTIPVGQSNTPTSGAGAVALDPLTAGTTTVTVSSAQAQTTTQNGSVNVTVSAPALTISTGTLGSGLQRQVFVQLGAAAPTGGVTVRLTSSQPSVVILSGSASAQGTGFVDVTIPFGATQGSVFAQALDGQTGTPTIQATAPGYSDGSIAQPVVTPALEIISLNATPFASATNDDFYVRVGVANANNQFLNEVLDRRAGGAPLAVTATNSNAGVAQLLVVGGATGQSVTASIAPGQSNTPTSGTGSFAFDPIAAGSTTVTATIPGFNTTINNGVVNVTVQAGLIQAAISGALR